jgi:hypothetical protein
MRGLSMWLCFGSWGGFHFEIGRTCFLRICLGYVSFVISSIDVENVIAHIVQENKVLKAWYMNRKILNNW